MADRKRIESLVDNAVNEALKQLLPDLCEQVVSRVMAQAREESTGSEISTLNRALAAIQAGITQVQILDAMLDGVSRFTARSALYIVRGSNAVGWRAKGFADDEAVRTTPLDVTSGLGASAIRSRENKTGPAEDFMQGFGEKFGLPQKDCMAFPLVVRDKVVALLYTDGGVEQHDMDCPALETLVRTTGLWLEVFATRKMTGSHTAASISEPPSMAVAAAAGAASTQTSFPPPPIEAPAVATPAMAPPSAPSEREDEIHKKAKRFAKLLVDEIKLYNQAKVTEGRQNRDIYDRLRDDIEKSRDSYEKRYGNTPAKDGDYFKRELIRILADNDASLFGTNFPQ